MLEKKASRDIVDRKDKCLNTCRSASEAIKIGQTKRVGEEVEKRSKGSWKKKREKKRVSI